MIDLLPRLVQEAIALTLDGTVISYMLVMGLIERVNRMQARKETVIVISMTTTEAAAVESIMEMVDDPESKGYDPTDRAVAREWLRVTHPGDELPEPNFYKADRFKP